jgi:hypothetical protein
VTFDVVTFDVVPIVFVPDFVELSLRVESKKADKNSRSFMLKDLEYFVNEFQPYSNHTKNVFCFDSSNWKILLKLENILSFLHKKN